MAGYSGTTLAQKLGIKAEGRVALIGAPPGFEATLDGLPTTARVVRGGRGAADVLVAFVPDAAALGRGLAGWRARIEPDGGLWVAWPKRASGVATDVTEDVVRAAGLAAGLVDNKVCAIDATWSGLRLVVRLVDRPGGRRGQPRKTSPRPR
jgi:hypothetical protein